MQNLYGGCGAVGAVAVVLVVVGGKGCHVDGGSQKRFARMHIHIHRTQRCLVVVAMDMLHCVY